MFAKPILFFMQGASFSFFIAAAIILIVNPKSNRLRKILSWILFFYAFLYLKDMILFLPVTGSDYLYPLLISIDMWTTPAICLFLVELLHPNRINSLYAFYHLSFFVIISLVYSIFPLEVILTIIKISYLLYATGMFIYFVKNIKKYNKAIANNYSYTENINIKWVKTVFPIFVIYFIMWMYICDIQNVVLNILYYIVSLFIWVYILIKTYNQEILNIKNVENSDASEKSENLLHSFPQIEELIKTKQLYLNPKLTLSDIASELDTNRTYLSNYINNELNTTFYKYINSFRVEHACEIMLDTQNNDTLEVISEKSGFNSLSTFNRTFKEIHHIPPSKYRNRNRHLQQ